MINKKNLKLKVNPDIKVTEVKKDLRWQLNVIAVNDVIKIKNVSVNNN